jgi:hypothetical protein
MMTLGSDGRDDTNSVTTIAEKSLADKPRVLAIGQAQLEKRVGKGPLPATMKALLRLLEIPEPIPVGTG